MGGSTTESERRDRIAEDDGPDEAVVWVSACGAGGSRRPAYHVDQDCQYCRLIDEQPMTRAAAQARGDYPCKLCVLDGRDERDSEKRECPYCGTETGDFSRHLPCEGVRR